MKAHKRLLSLLLSLILILSLVSTGFAQTSKQSPNKPNYEFYVPMGTSITGGYRLPGDGTGGTVNKPDGVFSNEYTYAYLVGNEFDIEGHYSGALLGTRTLEYRMLLEDDFPESSVDNYNKIWVGPRCRNGYEQLHNQLREEYKANLAKADLISVEIGLNDITSYAMCTLMTELEEEVKESGKEDIFAYLQSLAGDGVATSEDMVGLLVIAEYLDAYDEILERLTNYFMEGLEYYRENFPVVLKDIRTINPTADIFVVGCYNPLGYMLDHEITANENGNVDIKNLILEAGKTMSLSDEQTIYLFQLMEEFVVGTQNEIMKSACNSNNAHFVDVRGIDLSGSADGTHPYIAGHAFIADHLSKAIYDLYPCQHRHLTTYAAITPSTYIPGYTGNVFCVDCGQLIEMGRIITYSEYMRQQQQAGNVPSAEDVNPQTVDPFVPPADVATSTNLAGNKFIIAYKNRALGVTVNEGYTVSGSSNITASGLNGKTLALDEDNKIIPDSLTTDMLWEFESAGSNKYRIKNVCTDQYLGCNSSGWGSYTESLFLTDSKDYSWSYNNGALTCKKDSTTITLTFDTPETVSEGYNGSCYFFGAHRNSSFSSINLYAATTEREPVEVDLLGKCVTWKQSGIGEGTFCLVVNNYAVGLDAGRGISLQQISNDSQISDLSKRFQWKVSKTNDGYSFENVGNAGYYLGAYTESNLLSTKASLSVNTAPYSWQFTNNRLAANVKTRGFLNISRTNTYYLSCANGSSTLATGSAASTAKLYQAVKAADSHATLVVTEVPATCTTNGSVTQTCPVCGASFSRVIPAFDHVDKDPEDGRCDVCNTLMIEKESSDPSDPSEPSVTTYKLTVDGVKQGDYVAGTGVTATAGTKAGYTFTGWKAYRSNNNRNELNESALGLTAGDFTKNSLTFNMPGNTVYLVSQWSESEKHATVKIDNNKAVKYVVGKDVTVNAGDKAGYIFKNWTVKDSENNVVSPTDLGLENLTAKSLTFKMPEKNLVFTTEWEKDATYYVQVSGSSQKAYYAAGATVTDLSAGTKDNYVCTGWTVKDSDNNVVSPTDLGLENLEANSLTFTMPAKNLVFTPVWERDGVHFTVKVGNQTTYYAKGTSVTVSAGTKSGSVFKGWTATDTEGTAVDLGIGLATNSITFQMPGEDIVLTANWAAQHKVTVDGKTTYYLTGETVTLNAGTKDKATFDSWTVTPARNGKAPDDIDPTKSNATFTMPDNDLTITSKWNKTTFTVKFNSNGGTAYDSVEVDAGGTLNLNNYKPTKSGFTFDRWYLDEGLTQSASNRVTVNNNMTLYAGWTSSRSTGSGLFSGIQQVFRSIFRW